MLAALCSSSEQKMSTVLSCSLLNLGCLKIKTSAVTCWQERALRWAAVGIASLRDEQLSSLPAELWSAGPSIRVADLGSNRLTSVPASLAALTGLQRLRLSHNQLTDEGLPWAALAALPQLAVLALDHNRSALHMQCARTGH